MKDGTELRYVRLMGSDTWHWMERCSHFPQADDQYHEALAIFPARPSGDLCNECKAKEKKTA